jgi:hypothetical protein
MAMRLRLVIALLLAASAPLGASQDSSQNNEPSTAPAQGKIGYTSAKDADQRKTLLLRDFKPVPMLHASAHKVVRAKYYVIDVHNHGNDAMGIEEHMRPQRVIEVMNNANVKTVVILTGMWGDKLQRVIDEMVKPYPGRFVVFTQIDWSKINDPDFSQEMIAQLDDAVGRGARGLKVLKDLGLGGPRQVRQNWSQLTIRVSILSGKSVAGLGSRFPFTSPIRKRSFIPSTVRMSVTRN